ncbi:MAG TPA: hypothetical protein VK875_12600 [Euzebyales bacterium]|nr:hypothetical protein [Euzebyales bacterium]
MTDLAPRTAPGPPAETAGAGVPTSRPPGGEPASAPGPPAPAPADAQPRPPLAVRVVERAAALLSRRGQTRRQFLFKAALVGSALAVDPFGYAFKPGTAYASVCGSGNTCAAGWSVFCCTINSGANTCPDYSFVAGWWKVDASAFCLGAPRYYIDCNRRPNRSCSCRCNGSGCDRRRVCCNVFRYGQCNTQIRGVTQVVCRVITCTPPWEWDPRCGRSVRTDQSTSTHSSACLPGRNPSRIEIKYQDLGLVGSVVGRPDGRERDASRGGRTRAYTAGVIMWHRDHGAHALYGPVARLYRANRADSGPLGYPTTDHRPVGDGSGQVVRFERGSIYRKFGGATRMVLSRADRRYRNVGGPRGRLGYPTSNTRAADGSGMVTEFERGAIFMSPRTDPVEITGRFHRVYANTGGPDGSRLGFPTSAAVPLSDGGRRQRFERGVIIGPRPQRVHAVHGAIWRHWITTEGGPQGRWGYPVRNIGAISGKDGFWCAFQRAIAYWSEATGVHWFPPGPIYTRYRREGGAAGRLGFPTSDLTTSGGTQRVTFEHGVITHDPRRDATEVTAT